MIVSLSLHCTASPLLRIVLFVGSQSLVFLPSPGLSFGGSLEEGRQPYKTFLQTQAEPVDLHPVLQGLPQPGKGAGYGATRATVLPSLQSSRQPEKLQ